MNFLFGLLYSHLKVRPWGAFLRSNLGFCNGGLCLGTPTPEAKPRLHSFSFPFYSILSILFLFAFLLFPHTTHANGLQRAPSNLGLVGYWSLNEGTSTVVTDGSGYGNNGVFANISTPSTATSGWINGKLGKGIRLDGTDDYIAVGDRPSLKITGSVTLAAWVRHDSNTFKAWEAIIAKGDSTYRLSTCSVPASCPSGLTQDAFYFAVNAGPSGTVGSTVVPVTGVWYHVVATYDGATARIYINGVENANNAGTGEINNTTESFYIGENSGTLSRQWSGAIDEVRVYNRALSAAEVSALYGASVVTRKAVSNQGLMGYWPFNEGSGTTADDVSGNGNNGVLTSIADPATSISGWANGKRGKAINFDGTSDYVVAQSSPSLDMGSGDLTISTWVKVTGDTGIAQTVLVKGEAGTAGKRYGLHIDNVSSCPADTIDFEIDDDTTKKFVCSAATYIDNTWHHIAGVRSGNNLRLYVDGREDANSPTDITGYGNINSSRFLTIGGVWSNFPQIVDSFFSGSIDDVRVYNRALSAAEIAALANLSSSKVNVTDTTTVTNGLLANWTFDGKYMDWNANQALDSSGNSNTLQMLNTSTTTSPAVGKRGQALMFDGVNDYGLGPSIALNSRSFSVSSWIRRTQTGLWQMVLSQGAGSPGNGLHVGYRGTVNSFACAFYANDLDSPVYTDFDWHNFICSYDFSTGKRTIYRDGVQVAIDASPVTAYTGTGPVYIGVGTPIGVGQPGAGYIEYLDDIRIYNRPLTASESLQIYNAGK